MYETHFGLNKRPFRALAAGTDVFVGPQSAATLDALKKALATVDSIVAVSGPVGVGKTTLVRRALESVGDTQVVVSVARKQLGHDEVLELLLNQMGAELPTGTVQRFTAFRRLLEEYAKTGSRVFIVVEDAVRIGADALSELEALTAADAGVSDGANIILMGDEGLDEVLKAASLARLKQRLHLRQKIAPLSAGELMAYFKHCFRLAGNEFDTLFEQGTSELLHQLSHGIPRTANNLVDAALTFAAENEQKRIGVDLIKKVTTDELVSEDSKASSDVVAETAQEPEPVDAPVTTAPDEEDDAIPEFIQDTLPDLTILAPNLAEPDAGNIPTLDDEVPEWERDPTLAELRPDLDALEHAMKVAQGLAPDPEDGDEQAGQPEEPPEPVPEITLDKAIQDKIAEAAEELRQSEKEAAEQQAAAEAEDRDKKRVTATAPVAVNTPQPMAPPKPPAATAPAVVKPAAPAATAAVQPPAQAPTAVQPPAQASAPPVTPPAPAVEVKAPAPPPVEPPPEPVFETPVAAPPAAEATPAPPSPAPEVKAPAPPPDELPPQPVFDTPVATVPTAKVPQEDDKAAKKADAELERIASDLARAKTIDDCDDKMAETLFGEEFSLMAAQVAATAPPDLSANDDMESETEDVAAVPGADLDGAAAINVNPEAKPNGRSPKLDPSASQRLATVRALNSTPNHLPPVAAQPAAKPSAPAAPPPQPGSKPESIEDQFETSMTQTLETLSISKPPIGVGVQDDDDDDENSGFFGRFRRS